MEEGSNGKLEMALNHIRANIGAFTPRELEEMVRQRLIDARVVPAELRTDFVRRRLRLRK
jgi:hypothetical protein